MSEVHHTHMESRNKAEVIHVAETIRGGISTYLRVIFPLQVKRYGPGRVIAVVPRNHMMDLDAPYGVELIGFDQSRIRLMSAWRAYCAMRHILKERGASVVHVHSTFAGLVCRPLLWLQYSDMRVIYCPHGWAFIREGRMSFLVRIIERILSVFCDMIVCVSQNEFDAGLAVGISSKKMVVIRNGLQDHVIPSNSTSELWLESALRLLFIGRLDRQKGFDFLLEALMHVQRRIQIHVFGDSVLGDVIAKIYPDWVVFHGWTMFQVIEPYLETCHALLMPSRWEGLPLTALEAMRSGKAVIASNVGGLTEIVMDGITGVLLPPNDVLEWSRVIETLNTDKLAEMGKNGRDRYVRLFTAERVERDLDKIYI